MITLDNDSFPRGNRVVAPTKTTKRTHNDNLFVTEKAPKAKKPRKEKSIDKPESVSENSWQASLKLGGTLTYPKIQTGMIILSCIKRITNLSIQIELPGFTYALVSVKDISDSFTKDLTEKLKEDHSEEPLSILSKIFELGTLVPIIIQSHEYNDEDGHVVHASMNPKDVNSERNYNSFKKGSTIWANVVSELDHGYEISVGVKNCRVFLPFKNVNEGKKYQIGEPLFCVVHKHEQTATVTTLTVSAKKEHLEKIELKGDVYLQNVIPGTKVELLVEEVLTHGIKGTFLDNCFGYLDESQMFSLHLNKVKLASTIPVYVLYVEPITKVTYLTLHSFDVLPGPAIELGTVTNSEVISVRPKGLCLKIGKFKGYITNKRLLNSLPQQGNVDVVRKKYPVGSKSTCRILDFNRMEQLYVCTFEKKLLKEKNFTSKDLELAQSVTIKITKIIPAGFIASVGQITGFVPNLHISDSKFSENIKNKFAIGHTAKASVLNLPEEGNPIFTMKKSIVDSDKCLTKLEDVKANAQFVGVIVHTRASGALVSFYGGLTGWIRSKDLNPGSYTNPKDYFFRGQVVNVFIIGFSGEKLLVSLNSQSDRLSKKIRVGKKHKAKVVETNKDGLVVEIGRLKIRAVVPSAHLSNNLQICKLLLNAYEEGDVLSDIICLSNEHPPILSRREFLHFKKNGMKVKSFAHLREGLVLRCNFQQRTKQGILVTTLLKDYSEEILIPNENLIEEEDEYTIHQCIKAKIIKVDQKNKKLDLCVKSSASEKLQLDGTLNLLEEALADRMKIIQSAQKNNWQLVEYKIGQRVDCVVTRIDRNGECSVTLPNGVKGVVRANLRQPNLIKNSTVEGVVLDYNFINDNLEISLKSSLNEKIGEVQDGIIEKDIDSSVFVDIILKTDLYILGILRDSSCNKQLVYLPRGFSEDVEEIKLKVLVKRKCKDCIIGVAKRVWLNYEKEKKKRELLKLRRQQKRKTEQKNKSSDAEESDDEEEQSDDEDEQSGDEATEEQSDEEVEDLEEILIEEEEEMELDDEEADDTEMVEEEDSKTEAKSTGAPILSGVQSFFGSEDTPKAEDSSSDEETETELQKKKKKKLSSAERAELAKQEEARISKIENELADSTATPQSAEQFDRLLLANPNSSEIWLKYIAMHVATTELEKARTVGKRALETINMTLVQEKFNIWVALLNLENMYGTKESFDQLFDDAVKYNESLEVYLSVIKMFATSGKISEMEEKIKKVRAKEKQNIKMWLEIGSVYYSLDDFRSARNVKEAALRSISDNKRQFDLIVKFGIMEFQSGELEQAIANFETILETFPAKVNIWTIYVDQLIKKDKIDLARKLLERAVNQKFTLKNMKVLFQKYLNFEEKYGTPESAQEVKKRAADYVKSVR